MDSQTIQIAMALTPFPNFKTDSTSGIFIILHKEGPNCSTFYMDSVISASEDLLLLSLRDEPLFPEEVS